MTELRIDGVAVELPAGFSVSIKRENPFFTKSGEYTYDIELPLESSINAPLYDFLHRMNAVTDVNLKRRAVLTADNRVYLDGTEIITGWTDKNVKIQLVSGNSELNYIADEKTLLSDLSMPVTDPRLGGVSNPDSRYIENCYPTVDYCLPIVARADGSLFNNWVYLKGDAQLQQPSTWVPLGDPKEYDFIPQPFLIPYLEAVIRALGYTVSSNALRDTFARYICLVHSQNTYKWAEFFPGLTARDFLGIVENTFNVSYKFDFRRKSVDILLNRMYFFEVPSAFVQNVVDEYDCDSDDEQQDVIACNSKSFRLSYNFPSSKYYNEAALSEYVKSMALVVDDNFKGLFREYFDDDKKSTEKIYQIGGEIERARYDAMHWGDKEHLTGYPLYHYVDFFRDHSVGTAETTVKMQMIPAEITMVNDAPVIVSGDSVPKPIEEIKLDDILSMDKADIGDAGTLRMAFYKGMVNGYPQDSRIKSPNAFTDYTFPVAGKPRGVGVDPPVSLRPSSMAEEFFIGGYDIDITHPIKVKSFDVNLYDTSSVFVINNKRFLCRDIEYNIGADGRRGPWTGTFYPVGLSDTEAYKRWILTDGRWRDGGVWLDEGRWLDDKPINHDKNKDTI